MQKNTSVAHLIAHMTHSEKRHFMLRNQHAHRNKNYLQLFKLLQKNPDVGIAEVKRKLKKPVINFSQDKAYLQWQLLRALRQFHEDHSYTIQLQNTLSEIEVLFNKRLFDLCGKLITQYKPVARVGEYFTHLVQFIEWEHRCKAATLDTKYFNSTYKSVFREEQLAVKKEQELMEIRMEKMFLLTFLVPMGYLHNKDVSAFRLAVKKSEKRKIPTLLSTRSKLQQLELLFFGYQYLFELPRAMKCCREAVELFRAHPQVIRYHLGAYCAFMANYASLCIQLKKYDEAITAVELYEKTTTLKGIKVPIHLLVEIKINSTLYKLMIHAAKKEIKKGLAVVEAAGQHFIPVSKHKKKDGLVVYFFYAAQFYLFDKQPELSLENLNILFTEFKEIDRTDYFICSHFVQLLAPYDLRHWRIIPHKIQSLKRYLRTRKIRLHSQLLILKCFEAIERAQPAQHMRLFENLHSELNKSGIGNPDERYFIETLMIREWLENHK